ncbi:hypothetical protein MVEN_00008600 [Mycena venus]|uniref:Uncharacterized protein n=1 Tax=Mycena venus TaxID=2733690 RepID=A0A8H6Z635_9AGAR|nr:hypothetical protein MVEN_00008600 [Mycena venus]
MPDAPVGGKEPKPGKGKAQPGKCDLCIPPKEVPALQSHKRRVHAKKASVKYPDGVEDVIHRNPDSQKFHCKRCPQANEDGQALRIHCLTCNAVATASVPDDPDIHANGNNSTRATPELLGRTDLSRSRSLDPDAQLGPIPLADNKPEEEEDDEDTDYDEEEKGVPEDETDKDASDGEVVAKPPQPDAPPVNLAQIRRRRSPDEHTVIHHPTLNLPAFDIIINTLYRVVICLSCATAVELGSIEDHIHSHFPSIPVPNGLAAQLTAEYNLVSQKDIVYPRNSPPPIYGLRLTKDTYFFCGRCGRGYADADTLYSHQHQTARCPSNGLPNSHTIGFGQYFTMSRHHRIFQVDPFKLPPFEPETPDQAFEIYKATRPAAIDYSNTPFVMPLRDQDQHLLLNREGWGDHISSYTIGNWLVGHPQLVGHLKDTGRGTPVGMSLMFRVGVRPIRLVQIKF